MLCEAIWCEIPLQAQPKTAPDFSASQMDARAAPPVLTAWQAAGYKHAQKVLATPDVRGCLYWWTPGSGKSVMVALLLELLYFSELDVYVVSTPQNTRHNGLLSRATHVQHIATHHNTTHCNAPQHDTLQHNHFQRRRFTVPMPHDYFPVGAGGSYFRPQRGFGSPSPQLKEPHRSVRAHHLIFGGSAYPQLERG